MRRASNLNFMRVSGAWLPFCLGVVLCLCVASCRPDGAGCGTALGEMTTDTLILSNAISRLEIEGRIHVSWRPSEEEPVAIRRAGLGVIEGLSLQEESGGLHIKDNNTCHWVRDLTAIPEVELVGMSLEEIQLLGQGDFAMLDTLRGGNLTVEGDEMSGNISLRFSGDTLQLRLPNGIGHAHVMGSALRFRSFRSGFGDLDAQDLDAQQIMLHHGGLGQVDLETRGYLYLELAGHGDVHLHGQSQDQDIRILPGATGQVVEWP